MPDNGRQLVAWSSTCKYVSSLQIFSTVTLGRKLSQIVHRFTSRTSNVRGDWDESESSSVGAQDGLEAVGRSAHQTLIEASVEVGRLDINLNGVLVVLASKRS
jgi:hypothetical protein